MPVSTNLELPLLSESQTQKATLTNESIRAIEEAVTGKLLLDTSAAVTPGFDVTIPFDDTNDLSPRKALRMIYLELTAGATADFNVIHPDNTHLFYCRNLTTKTATIKTLAGTGFALEPGKATICYCDGTNIVSLTANMLVIATRTVQDFDVAVYSKPTDAQVIAKFIVGRACTIPTNFAGSVGKVGTNPSALNTFTVKADGSAIGTFDVSTGGVFTFVTTGNLEQSLSAGQIVTVENQAVADSNLANMNVCLQTITTI